MKKLHESLKRKRQQQMYKVLTIHCFQNFLLSEILQLGWRRQTDGRSHLSDHRRVKTWFEIQKVVCCFPGWCLINEVKW